jgi:hypothetical protein
VASSRRSAWGSALSRSGGLAYHFAAWRHGHLWADHQAATAQFLGAWQTSEQKLVLVGTSAGYSLSNALFERFSEVRASEPDPVARRLFRRRFPEVQIQWLDDDFVSPRNGAMSVAGLTELRALFADHAVLFCNILGQLPFLFAEASGEGFARYLGEIPSALQGASWASYHDRVSGPWPPSVSGLAFDSAVGTDALVNAAFTPLAGGQSLAFSDHQTGPLAPDLPRQMWLWQRTPGDFHLIEGVSVSR